MNVFTTILSSVLDKTDVTEIGLYSAGILGCATFGTGIIFDSFHWVGKTEFARESLNIRVNGAARTGAPSLRNHDGSPSRPVDVRLSPVKSLNTCCSFTKSFFGPPSESFGDLGELQTFDPNTGRVYGDAKSFFIY